MGFLGWGHGRSPRVLKSDSQPRSASIRLGGGEVPKRAKWALWGVGGYGEAAAGTEVLGMGRNGGARSPCVPAPVGARRARQTSCPRGGSVPPQNGARRGGRHLPHYGRHGPPMGPCPCTRLHGGRRDDEPKKEGPDHLIWKPKVSGPSSCHFGRRFSGTNIMICSVPNNPSVASNNVPTVPRACDGPGSS